MRIKSNTILTGVVIVLGIIIFVGGLRSIFDFNPTRDSTYDKRDRWLYPHLLGIGAIYLRHSNHPRLHTT